MPAPPYVVPYMRGLLLQSNAPQARAYLGIGAAGVNFISAGTESDAGGIVFANSNGVTFGMSNSTVTASVAAGGGLTNIKLSAGTKSALRSDVTFNDANGVSFGLDAAGVITASVQTNYLSAFKLSAGALSATRSDVTFADSNGLSFGLSNNGVITAAYSTLSFANSNNVTFGIAGGTLTASFSAASTQASIVFSAGSQSILSSGFTFADSNGVTFGMSNGVITASVAATAAGNSVNFSAGTTSNNLASVVFADSNGVSFGLNAGTITAIFSQTGAPAGTISFFMHPPNGAQGIASITSNATVYAVDPFWLPLHGSFDFLRAAVFASYITSQFATSNAATTYSAGHSTTFKMGIYSMGTGASSSSLMSVSTFTAGATFQGSLSATGSQYTRGLSYTFPASNGSTTFTATVATSSASILANETRGNLGLIGANFDIIDFPFQFSLTPGAYWMLVGIQDASSAHGDTRFGNNNVRVNYAGISQFSRARLMFSSDLDPLVYAQGAYSATGNAPPDTIDMVSITPDSNNNPRWIWNALRIA